MLFAALTDEEKAARPFTAEEACDYLKISRATLTRLLNSGQLAGKKVGGTWRFTRAALDEFLSGNDAGKKAEKS